MDRGVYSKFNVTLRQLLLIVWEYIQIENENEELLLQRLADEFGIAVVITINSRQLDAIPS